MIKKTIHLIVSLVGLLCFSCDPVMAATATVEFTPTLDPSWTTCVLIDDLPSIDDRITIGNITSMHGQCTTTTGQSSVMIANIPRGSIYYFTAYRLNANGDRSKFADEIIYDIPLDEKLKFHKKDNT